MDWYNNDKVKDIEVFLYSVQLNKITIIQSSNLLKECGFWQVKWKAKFNDQLYGQLFGSFEMKIIDFDGQIFYLKWTQKEPGIST